MCLNGFFLIHEELHVNYAQCFHQAVFTFSRMVSTCTSVEVLSCFGTHGLEGTHEFGTSFHFRIMIEVWSLNQDFGVYSVSKFMYFNHFICGLLLIGHFWISAQFILKFCL